MLLSPPFQPIPIWHHTDSLCASETHLDNFIGAALEIESAKKHVINAISILKPSYSIGNVNTRIPADIASNLFLNLIFPEGVTMPKILVSESVIVVIDQITRTHVIPKPMENTDLASYRVNVPSGVPFETENSKRAGSPIAQIAKMITGTKVVVINSSAVSQFLSLG